MVCISKTANTFNPVKQNISSTISHKKPLELQTSKKSWNKNILTGLCEGQ